MASYRAGLKAGAISGLVWAVIMSVIGIATIELSYSQTFDYYNGLYASNQTVFGGMTPPQYINYLLELNTAYTFGLALAFGALIGLILVIIGTRFLGNRSYATKSIVIAFFFWVVYELAIGVPTAFWILSSLAVSILAGYLLGYLYLRFTGPPEVPFTRSDSVSGQDSTQPFSGNQP